jgi:Nuclease A inhibitor-like protein
MHNDTAQLLALIESTIQGVIFRSENNYALKPLVWDVSTQDEFDISCLLKSTDNLVPIELDDFLSWQEYSEDFDRWHEFLAQNPEYTTFDRDDFLDRHDRNQEHITTDEENNDCECPDYLDIELSERCDFVRHRAEKYEVFLSKSVVMEQRYRSLLNILETCTTHLQVYRVVKYDDAVPCRDEDEIREFYLDNDFTDDEIAEYEARMEEENLRAKEYSNDRRSGKEVFESIKILVGKVSDDCWIGISPICSNIEFPDQPTLEKFLAQQIENDDTAAIESKLKPILDALTFITRNFYNDFEQENRCICEFAKTESEVINRLLHLSNFVNTWEFKGIGYARTGYFGIDEASRFDRIDELLTSHLKNLRVYVVGTTSMFDLYAIGQAENGNWLGVSTTAIWTG